MTDLRPPEPYPSPPAPVEKPVGWLRRFINRPSLRFALGLFAILRVGLTAWAALLARLLPLPVENTLAMNRIFLGQPPIDGPLSFLLLQPWQRHDSLRYLRIALEGYANVEDSVFPPLYPLLMRFAGRLITPLMGGAWLDGTGSETITYRATLLAGLIISNLALIIFLVLFYEVTAAERSEPAARRALVRLAIFPSAFFLLAAFSEPLFLLLALGSVGAARRQQPWLAGLLALLATWTRTTGMVLVMPLAYEYLRQRDFRRKRLDLSIVATLLPVVATLAFLLGRAAAGLPSLTLLYERFWLQTTAFPGWDVLVALRLIVAGEADLRLYLDVLSLVFMAATTVLVWTRLPRVYGLYALFMLLFILLPHSELKPLFSFSRYALAFFPSFMILGEVMARPWPNRLVIYPFIMLYLLFSGQFFIGGWVG